MWAKNTHILKGLAVFRIRCTHSIYICLDDDDSDHDDDDDDDDDDDSDNDDDDYEVNDVKHSTTEPLCSLLLLVMMIMAKMMLMLMMLAYLKHRPVFVCRGYPGSEMYKRDLASRLLNFFHAQLNWTRNFKMLIKNKIPKSEEVSCFKSVRCGIYHANKC